MGYHTHAFVLNRLFSLWHIVALVFILVKTKRKAFASTTQIPIGEVLMRMTNQTNRQAAWLVILTGFLFLFTASFVAAQDSSSGMSIAEPIFIQGSVRKVAAEKNTIYLKASKGEKFQVLVAPETTFVGMSSLAELKKGKRLKIWYRLDGKDKKAVKIELLIDTGC
jgi:hypothetical protein